MRPIARTFAAALPLLALLGLTPSAKAQTAIETVTYLTLGVEASAPTSDDYFRREFTANGADELRYQLHSVRSGSKLADLTITQVAPCQFTIVGQDFMADRIVQRDTTLNFRSIAPTQSIGQFPRFPNMKGWEEIRDYYLIVGGVKVCSKGEVFGMAFERSPASGTCRDQLQTWPFSLAVDRDRQIAALNHLRTNFCKPRAF